LARLNAANSAETILTQSINASVTSVEVENASILPDAPFRLSIGLEILEVTAKSGNTLTVLRSREGTTALAHGIGDKAGSRFTAGMYDELITDDEVDAKIDDIPTPTKNDVGLGNVANVEQASKTEFNTLNQTVTAHLAEKASHGIYEDEGNEPDYQNAEYKLVVINGEPFLEVVAI